MEKIAGEEKFNQKESHAETNRQAHIHLAEHVAKSSEKDNQESQNEATTVEARSIKGNDECDQVSGEGQDPKKRNGGDILRQETSDRA